MQGLSDYCFACDAIECECERTDPINHCQQCDTEINSGERICDDWDCASKQHDEET